MNFFNPTTKLGVIIHTALPITLLTMSAVTLLRIMTKKGKER